MADPIVPASPPPTGTIDITNFVENLRQTWVTWAVAFLYGEEIAIPGMAWVALPVISTIDKDILKLILDFLSKDAVMAAFFVNTAIRKASQAADYVDAINAKKALPSGSTDDQYKNAEIAELAAFRDFVLLSN